MAVKLLFGGGTIAAILLVMFLAVTGPDRQQQEAAKYDCPIGTEPIRAAEADWFCAARPTVKPNPAP
jgi:hypothetical protein